MQTLLYRTCYIDQVRGRRDENVTVKVDLNVFNSSAVGVRSDTHQ